MDCKRKGGAGRMACLDAFIAESAQYKVEKSLDSESRRTVLDSRNGLLATVRL